MINETEKPKIHLVVLELTERCNLACKHCYGEFGRLHDIDDWSFEKTIRELRTVGCKMINFSGGEPLLLGPKIFKYALKIKQRLNSVLRLTTNGTLIDSFADPEMFCIFDDIQISLDGDQKTHDEIRGEGVYQRATTNLVLLKNRGCKVSVMMTVNKRNLDSIKTVYDFISKLGIGFSIERFTPVGRGNRFSKGALSSGEWKSVLEWAVINNVGVSDPLRVIVDREIREFLLKHKIMGGCSAGMAAICIDAGLNILPCPRLRISCGCLKFGKLQDILGDCLMKGIRDRKKLKGRCSRCRLKMVCGGCRAHSFSYTRDILGEDPLCFFSE